MVYFSCKWIRFSRSQLGWVEPQIGRGDLRETLDHDDRLANRYERMVNQRPSTEGQFTYAALER